MVPIFQHHEGCEVTWLEDQKSDCHAAVSYINWKTFVFIKNTMLMLPHGHGTQVQRGPQRPAEDPYSRLQYSVKKRDVLICF